MWFPELASRCDFSASRLLDTAEVNPIFSIELQNSQWLDTFPNSVSMLMRTKKTQDVAHASWRRFSSTVSFPVFAFSSRVRVTQPLHHLRSSLSSSLPEETGREVLYHHWALFLNYGLATVLVVDTTRERRWGPWPPAARLVFESTFVWRRHFLFWIFQLSIKRNRPVKTDFREWQLRDERVSDISNQQLHKLTTHAVVNLTSPLHHF